MTLFYSIPPALLLIFALAVAILLAGAGQTYVHRHFRREDFLDHNDVAGIMMAVSGTLYAVVLGFLTVVVWEHYMEARQLVVAESDSNLDVWHLSVGLPATVRERVRNDMIRYAQIMADSEWPLMKQGRYDVVAAAVALDAIDVTGSFVPANESQSNAQTATLQKLTAMHDARLQRIAINGVSVSWFEWLILVICASSLICFCWLFGVRSERTQMLMTSLVTTIIVCMLVLLFELQYPFRSGIGIGPDDWRDTLMRIDQLQSGALTKMK